MEWPTVSHSPLFFSSLLLCSFLFIYFVYIIFDFFGTIICLQCPRPWRKVFILINKTRWSAESWLLDFQLISESYQFEFLLSPIWQLIWNVNSVQWFARNVIFNKFFNEYRRSICFGIAFVEKGTLFDYLFSLFCLVPKAFERILICTVWSKALLYEY